MLDRPGEEGGEQRQVRADVEAVPRQQPFEGALRREQAIDAARRALGDALHKDYLRAP